MKLKNFFTSYKSIVAFLILEVLALVAFNFGDISEILFLISALLSAIAFVFSFFSNVDRKDFLKMIPVVAGLFIISGIAAFGGFSTSHSILSNIATFLALPAFFSLGFFARRLGYAKPEHMILAIGVGLGLVVLISTIATWVEYGLFYAQIHKDKPIYFYEGTAYNVTKEMNFLVGFKIVEVSLEYGGTFALLCAIFLPSLLFLNPKEHKIEFSISAAVGAIGLISILSVPNWRALVFFVIASLFALVFKFFRHKMVVVNALSLVVVCVVGIGCAFYLISIINGGISFKFTGIFNKLLCENFIMRGTVPTLMGAFGKNANGVPNTLFGFDITKASYSNGEYILLNSIVQTPTLIFEYEIMKEVGLIGTAFVLALFATMFVFEVRYLRDSKDSAFMKNVIIMMLVAFMLISSFGFDVKPQTHNQDFYQAFLRSIPFMIALFLFGYTYFVPNQEPQKQEPKKVEDISL